MVENKASEFGSIRSRFSFKGLYVCQSSLPFVGTVIIQIYEQVSFLDLRLHSVLCGSLPEQVRVQCLFGETFCAISDLDDLAHIRLRLSGSAIDQR